MVILAGGREALQAATAHLGPAAIGAEGNGGDGAGLHRLTARIYKETERLDIVMAKDGASEVVLLSSGGSTRPCNGPRDRIRRKDWHLKEVPTSPRPDSPFRPSSHGGGGLFDQCRNLAGMRHRQEMVFIDIDDLRARAFRHPPLEIGRNRAVADRNRRPSRDVAPGHSLGLIAEDGWVGRRLRHRREPGVGLGQAGRPRRRFTPRARPGSARPRTPGPRPGAARPAPRR